MKRSCAAVLVVLLAALLTGCVTVSQHLTIHEGGGAEVALAFLMPQSVWSMVATSEDFDLDQVQEEVTSTYPGTRVEEVLGEQNEGIRFIVPFKSKEEALAVLSSGNLFGSTEAVQESPGLFSSISYKQKGNFLNSYHEFSAEPDPEVLEEFGESMPGGGELFNMEASAVSLRFSLTVPDPIEAAPNGTLSDDRRTVTWRISQDTGVLSAATEARPAVPLWVLGVGALALVGGATVLVLRGRGST